jgi:phosphate transport system protein
MSKHLERDLEDLQQSVLAMATAVEEAISRSVQALQERQVGLARQIIEGDNQIDQQENRIEQECLKLLALHQPVAIDLRRIAAILKINTDLERMADLAVNIAERGLRLADLPPIAVPEKLDRMSDLTKAMVRQSLDAFFKLDANEARRVCRQDDDVDRWNSEIITELVLLMGRSPELIEPGLSLFSATRHLERIADHATNIAEDVIYLVEGEIVRHRPRNKSPRRFDVVQESSEESFPASDSPASHSFT